MITDTELLVTLEEHEMDMGRDDEDEEDTKNRLQGILLTKRDRVLGHKIDPETGKRKTVRKKIKISKEQQISTVPGDG